MNNIRVKDAALLLLVGFILLVLGVAIFSNLKGFESGVGEFVAEIWLGAKMIFFTALGLGTLYGIVLIRQHTKVRIVRPGSHGQAQALIVQERKGLLRVEQRIEQLNTSQTQMDPRQQIELLHQIMKVSTASAMSDQRLLALLAKQQQTAVPQIEPPQERIVESIAEVVRYEEVADEIPPELSLLGIHPGDGSLELTAWEKLKCLWIVGSSSTGKSNTVFGKAKEAKDQRAKFAIIDQHIVKPDSLGRKMLAYESSFLRPIAVSDQEVLATLAWFKAEFEARVACKACAAGNGSPCQTHAQKIVLVADEMNRMNRNETLRKPLQEIVAICGEESRGFGMYGWFLSQKCAGLKWLRDSAITVIVHRLTRFEEALLACNDDRKAARKLLGFKIGRTYVYGVDIDEPMELQQALYPMPKNDSPATWPDGEVPTSTDELPATSPHTDDLTYFTQGGKQDEVEKEEDFFYAQNTEKIQLVAQMMIGGKSVNQILAAGWGITAPGGAYQAALPELREIQKYIARRAFGSASEAGLN
jgi:hypothetical protein